MPASVASFGVKSCLEIGPKRLYIEADVIRGVRWMTWCLGIDQNYKSHVASSAYCGVARDALKCIGIGPYWSRCKRNRKCCSGSAAGLGTLGVWIAGCLTIGPTKNRCERGGGIGAFFAASRDPSGCSSLFGLAQTATRDVRERMLYSSGSFPPATSNHGIQ